MATRFQLPSGTRWSGHLVTALVAGAIAIVVLFASLGGAVSALFRSGAEDVRSDLVEPLIARHE